MEPSTNTSHNRRTRCGFRTETVSMGWRTKETMTNPTPPLAGQVEQSDDRFSFELAARKGLPLQMTGIDFQRNDDDDYKWAVTRRLYEFWKESGRAALAARPATQQADEPKDRHGDDSLLKLLNHIEDVVDDTSWRNIDSKLWSAVTCRFANHPPIQAEAALARIKASGFNYSPEWAASVSDGKAHPAPVGEVVAASAEPQDDAGTVADLAMLVRRLVRRLEKDSPGTDLTPQALDYLKRKGLQGSPLRTAQDSQEKPQ